MVPTLPGARLQETHGGMVAMRSKKTAKKMWVEQGTTAKRTLTCPGTLQSPEPGQVR